MPSSQAANKNMPISVNHSNKMGSILLCGLDHGSRKNRIFTVSPRRRGYVAPSLLVFIALF
jgi:hypothetical protein